MTDSRNSPSPEETWAAFDSSPQQANEVTGADDEFFKETAGEESDDEWNDFESASTPQAAFAGAPSVEPACPAPTDPVPTPTLESAFDPSLCMETLLCDLGRILNSCWNEDASNEVIRKESAGETENNDEIYAAHCSDNHSLSVLSVLLGENGDTRPDTKNEEQDSCDVEADVLSLWTSLRLIEEAAALKYQLGETKAYERHLNALRMDLKLAKIRNPKLPAFAWQLSNSALTPERPTAVNSGSFNSPSPTSCEQSSAGNGCSTAERGPFSVGPVAKCGSSSAANAAAVPSVQFDWSSSGLNNPLSEGIVDSSSMDLDYYSSKMVTIPVMADGVPGALSSNGVVDTWKTDMKLLGLVADEDSTCNSIDGDHSTPSIAKSHSCGVNLLEKLMNSNHRTTSNVFSTSSESTLSNQTRRLVDSLPDLSFMLSPVLMFPIREDIGRSDGDDVQL